MEEWKEYRIGDLGRIVTGKTPKTSIKENYGGIIPFLTPSDDLSNKYAPNTNKKITELGLDEVKNCLLPPNSVCVSCIGSDLGKVVMLREHSVTNQQFNSIIPNDEFCPDYIYYLMTIVGKELNFIGKTSTAVPIVNKSSFSNTEVKVPSFPTQQKIANILSSLDDKIEVNRRINEQLEELAGALFKSWFVDFEPFKDGEFVDSELGMIPKGWKVVEVGELCESISVKHKFDKDELIFLNTGDIHNNIYLHNNYMPINEMPGQAKKSIRKGDILYSEIRPINKHFAFVNFEANDYVVSTKLMVIRCRNINNLRLYQYLTSNEIIDFLQQEAETRSGTFPQIRFENIQRLKMIIASPIVEEQYDKNLLPIYNKIETNNKEIHHLTTLRDTLLPKLMSGEIDVSEVDM